MIKLHTHALLTYLYANRILFPCRPEEHANSHCPFCGEQDTSTHWYRCPQHQAEFADAVRKISSRLPQPIAITPLLREQLTWGIVPTHMPLTTGETHRISTKLARAIGNQWIPLANAIWRDWRSLWAKRASEDPTWPLEPGMRLVNRHTERTTAELQKITTHLENTANSVRSWTFTTNNVIAINSE